MAGWLTLLPHGPGRRVQILSLPRTLLHSSIAYLITRVEWERLHGGALRRKLVTWIFEASMSISPRPI